MGAFSIFPVENLCSIQQRSILVQHVTAHPEINDNLVISFGTNGTLLEKSLDWLSALKRLETTVSLDGVGSAYEYIRGGSWQHMDATFSRSTSASGPAADVGS